MAERMDATTRKKQLLEAAYIIAKTQGIKKLTRAALARACGVTDGLINRYFDGREGMRAEVIAAAHVDGDAKTLAQCAAMYELPTMSPELTKRVERQIKALQSAP